MRFEELLQELPEPMRSLPRDRKGRPIPWFVDLKAPYQDGCPDFRMMSASHMKRAIRERRCWVCGRRLREEIGTFLAGPMCGINRTSGEPPSHIACARWSARGCPFLSHPRRTRDDRNMPANKTMVGIGLTRNPGVAMLWTAPYKLLRLPAGVAGVGAGTLFELGEPYAIEWWAEGRDATRAEVMESISTGLPHLVEKAELEGPEAVAELGVKTQEFIRRFVPKSTHQEVA